MKLDTRRLLTKPDRCLEVGSLNRRLFPSACNIIILSPLGENGSSKFTDFTSSSTVSSNHRRIAIPFRTVVRGTYERPVDVYTRHTSLCDTSQTNSISSDCLHPMFIYIYLLVYTPRFFTPLLSVYPYIFHVPERILLTIRIYISLVRFEGYYRPTSNGSSSRVISRILARVSIVLVIVVPLTPR